MSVMKRFRLRLPDILLINEIDLQIIIFSGFCVILWYTLYSNGFAKHILDIQI